MSELARLQSQFLAALFDARGTAADEERAVQRYRRGALANLCGALEGAYPVVGRLVGPAFLGEAARRYALATPSRHGDLQAFGGAFGAFLERYAPARKLPWLGDVARLEWCVHRCLHAPDAPPLAFEALARVAPGDYGRLRLRLRPGVGRVASAYPVRSIWEANQPGHDGVLRAGRRGGERVLIRRESGEVRLRALDAAEWELLRRLARGDPLAAASEPYGARPRALEAALVRQALEGIFGGFDLAP